MPLPKLLFPRPDCLAILLTHICSLVIAEFLVFLDLSAAPFVGCRTPQKIKPHIQELSVAEFLPGVFGYANHELKHIGAPYLSL